jgi:KDO2-lipid IV(A) lauroyltransferase
MDSESPSVPFGRSARYRLEYVFTRAALSLFDRLSPESACRAAAAIGGAWFTAHGSRRRLAVANVLAAGLAVDERHARSIARSSFRHFAMTLVESLKMRELLPAESWRERVEWTAPSETESLIKAPGKGAITVTGHIGSWGLAGYVISFMKPVDGIVRPLNNPHTNRIMQERMRFGGLRLIPKHDANPGRLLTVLKRGDILALLFDQFAVHQSVNVDFFGRPAATYSSPALLHLVGVVPLVFGYCVRTGPMRFKLELSEPLQYPRTGDRDTDVRTVLVDLSRRLETVVRAYPEQYLWAHRRWRG